MSQLRAGGAGGCAAVVLFVNVSSKTASRIYPNMSEVGRRCQRNWAVAVHRKVCVCKTSRQPWDFEQRAALQVDGSAAFADSCKWCLLVSRTVRWLCFTLL